MKKGAMISKAMILINRLTSVKKKKAPAIHPSRPGRKRYSVFSFGESSNSDMEFLAEHRYHRK